MRDYKLKLILSMLAGIVFSFIFILLAFSLPPAKETKAEGVFKPKNKLEEVSRSFKER